VRAIVNFAAGQSEGFYHVKAVGNLSTETHGLAASTTGLSGDGANVTFCRGEGISCTSGEQCCNDLCERDTCSGVR
jgi:hypothetical protein